MSRITFFSSGRGFQTFAAVRDGGFAAAALGLGLNLRLARTLAVTSVLASSALISGATSQAHAATGYFSDAQAESGHQLFNNHCAECHRPDLTGAMGPALIGKPFLQHWGGQSVEALYQFEHTKMPATNPGSLPADQVMAITAYILKRNGLTGGGATLDEKSAKTLTIPTEIPAQK